MEIVGITLDAEEFDKAIRTQPGGPPVLPESGDVRFIVKPKATVQGNAGVCITFTVELPDGTFARAQAVITAKLLEAAGMAIKGWREGGHI